jgi:hypothetical protein
MGQAIWVSAQEREGKGERFGKKKLLSLDTAIAACCSLFLSLFSRRVNREENFLSWA